MSKSNRESQLSYGFTYLWNIRNSMEDIKRRKGKMKGVENQRGSGLWTLGKKTEGYRWEGRG